MRRARYVGTPSKKNDWHGLYLRSTVSETLQLINREGQEHSPHRIIVLYVPSHDSGKLVSALDFVCFLGALRPRHCVLTQAGTPIGWRHNKSMVIDTIKRKLGDALRETNALKADITDKSISALTLPAHNFYHPDRNTTISSAYRSVARSVSSTAELKGELAPTRFTRDQLPGKAFKGRQHTDRFYQDQRGRVFPPDLFHAQTRVDAEGAHENRLSLALRQRYRFGVTVRDGNLHYDVQYENPRKLQREPMCCAADGEVWVSGSHANVGVNDVIWAPGGVKEQRPPK